MKEHFDNLGFEIDGILHLTGRQAFTCLQNGVILVDIREDFEIAIKDFGIKGKLWCPFSDFDKLFRTLPLDHSMIIADCVSTHSKEATRKLLENGYSRVANLAGGIADWERDGLPMNNDIESMNGQCPCMIRSKPA
jgi:rhodanese-related sulfurtransferase